MTDTSSVRRALSLVRDQISPTADDKARLRARIVAPEALLATGSPSANTPGTGSPSANTPPSPPHAPGAAALSSGSRWAALKAAGSAGVAAGLALLGAGGGVGFWLGHAAGVDSVRGAPPVAMTAADSTATDATRGLETRRPSASVQSTAGAPPHESAPLEIAPRASASSTGNAPVEPTANAPVEPTANTPVAPTANTDLAPIANTPRAEPSPRAIPARRRPPTSPLDDELALLRRVERALRNNDPALARALLRELDERFPGSRLGEERSAARRIADCRSGEPGAREEARAFLQRHGASVYRQRIALACSLGEAPVTDADGADTHVR